MNIGISAVIDVDKTSDSYECRVCNFWYFFRINFIHEPLVYNDCHDLLQNLQVLIMLCMLSLLEEVIIGLIFKSEAVNRKKNALLSEKNRQL